MQLSLSMVELSCGPGGLQELGIVLVCSGADEAREVCKHLPDVLAAHGDTIRVEGRCAAGA